MLTTLILYLILGAAAGLTAGLFGIGGGLLIVPVLIIVFELQGVPETVLTHAAVATSLATIVVTSISSVLAHHKRGAVLWQTFKPLSIGIVFGAFLGVKTAGLLPGAQLQIIFGLFAFAVALQMAFSFKPSADAELPAKPKLIFSGGVIGWGSAIFGIGGGTLTVPFLTWKKVQMQQAVATAAACGLPIALVGASTNIYQGWEHVDMPQWSLGYIYLPAFAGIVITSTPFAKVGAKLAHSLPADKLKKVFAIFLLIVAFRLLYSNLI
ncbi:MAG: sulfite exporter TauE/SafE family protein [Pseudomonadales bacterium]|nr:sulfite exporter TauE/SafE family protein [Pseudomonadales bacterium]NRA14862.1 sulfite exporter TauE/SafE family protein [Oceanospirillaceae bacterium]